ncbi:MAG: hypothetical protein HEP71_29055 [Roseivirga sp.]|nr:hypothetical protein [Roseivirga sp.]
MAEENDIALIESYLQGELDAERSNEVEQRLAQNTDFRLLFEDIKTMTEGMGKLKHKSLLERIDKLETGLENPLTSKKETKVVYWTIQRIAAAFIGLAVIATVSWFALSRGSQVDKSTLYAEYFTAYENVIVPRVRSDEDVTLLVRTFRAYDDGDYTTAVELFDELLIEDQRVFVRFYGAIAYMENGNTAKTLDLLKGVINEHGDFETQATWYLALNYIKREDYDNAKSLLEELAGSSTTYQKKAQELLKKMR